MSASVVDLPAATGAVETPVRGWTGRLFEPVPIGPLVLFRIALGLVLVWEAYRYLSEGWPRLLYLDRAVLFKYYGFGWVTPLPERLHLAVVPVLGVLALFVAAGAFYRVAAALLFVGWAYIFLLDQSLYLNHLYLVTLLAGLMAVLPANRACSLDVVMGPALRADFVPRWTVGLLRFQVGLVYVFGGIAKLGGDWLSGVPMQMMLLERADLFGGLAGEPWMALFFAYGGLLLDLLIVPLLIWRRTRVFAVLLACGFHLMNHVLFRIGIFPWAMMAATLILWPPVPMTLLRFVRVYGVLVVIGLAATVFARDGGEREVPLWAWSIVPLLAAAWTTELWWPDQRRYDLDPTGGNPPSSLPAGGKAKRAVVVALLGAYAAWQVLLPLRHWAYPGDANWTEEGHKWSWQMKLRVKHAAAVMFYVYDGRGTLIDLVDPFDPSGPLPERQAGTMATRPELVLQFAHHLARVYAGRGPGPIKVTATVRVALDGRPPAPLIDPKADLAAIEDRLWPPAEWVLPLEVGRPRLARVEVVRRAEGRAENDEL